MILFINQSARVGIYQGLGDSLRAIEPPIWCRLLASYCQQKGIEVDILDADARGLNAEGVALDIQIRAPTLAVIVAHGQQPSASTQLMDSVITASKAIKELCPGVPVLIVGGHPAALPERTLQETGADYVCTGEGPATIASLLGYLKGKESSFLSHVPGLVYRTPAGNIARTMPAENVWNLDTEMPGGMWNLLSMDRYRAHNWHCFGLESRRPYASVHTSLNCPYQCSFCVISSPFREGDRLRSSGKDVNFYRMWSSKHAATEIQLLMEKYGVTNIKIADEMMVLNRAHVLGICDELVRRGLGDRLNLWCYARVDTLRDQALLDRMRAAGFRWVGVGIESASEHVRDGVDKADYGVKDIFEACRKIRAAGINLAANFMFGLPDDNEKSMRETLDMAFGIMPEWCNFYCTVAYPGTALYNQAVAEGWELPASWSSWSHYAYDYLPLRTKHLTAAEVLRFRDDAFQKFYKSPSYQSHILTRFGPRALVEVQEMARVPLKRKL